MGTRQTVQRLTPESGACLAGVIDGEGTITLTADHPNERRTIVVSISNNDRSLLEFVRDTVGAGHITAKRVYDERHSPSHAYKISNRQALDLLAQVARYSRLR
jgi:hypothetical protein